MKKYWIFVKLYLLRSVFDLTNVPVSFITVDILTFQSQRSGGVLISWVCSRSYTCGKSLILPVLSIPHWQVEMCAVKMACNMQTCTWCPQCWSQIISYPRVQVWCSKWKLKICHVDLALARSADNISSNSITLAVPRCSCSPVFIHTCTHCPSVVPSYTQSPVLPAK